MQPYRPNAMQSDKAIRIVIVTGLSGSGKSTCLKVLEDLGFYCVDNLPPVLFPTFVRLCEGFTWEKISRVALGMDIRERTFLKDYPKVFEELKAEGYQKKEVAKRFGVDPSTVSKWYSKMNKESAQME